ncbi:hypothetical protein [Streptomyces sp. NPDC051286]|uniref:hypothetical protein n=1 Tax=Streptomyces sp. NPDC051286 TaxID=3365647 RepID=UPI003793F3FF
MRTLRPCVPYATNHVRAESLLFAPDRAYERVTGEERDRDTRFFDESYSNIVGWAGRHHSCV